MILFLRFRPICMTPKYLTLVSTTIITFMEEIKISQVDAIVRTVLSALTSMRLRRSKSREYNLKSPLMITLIRTPETSHSKRLILKTLHMSSKPSRVKSTR